jgi:hypothetical protein
MDSADDDGTFGDDQLERLAGEPLPPRTLMSVVAPFGHDPAPAPAHAAPLPAPADTTTLFACQQINDGATPGVLGLDSLATPSHSSHVCIPAAVHGTAAVYACQLTKENSAPGVLGLGLLATPSRSSAVCTPAVIHTP